MKEKEESLEEKIEAMNQALEQLRTESANLLLVFKRQVAFERENKDSASASEMAQKHMDTYGEIIGEWRIIKALYAVLVSNVQSVSDIRADEKMRPIEVILNKISNPESPFFSHEFQFPFNLSVLLSGIRNAVKNFIKYTNPNLSTQAYGGSNDGSSLTNLADVGGAVSAGPINTNNVKNAAKKFEEITEKVAESAIRLKRSGPTVAMKSSGVNLSKPEVPNKLKGEALFARMAQETNAKPFEIHTTSAGLAPQTAKKSKAPAPGTLTKPSFLKDLAPVLNGQPPNKSDALTVQTKQENTFEELQATGSDEVPEILQLRTPTSNTELDNPLRTLSTKAAVAVFAPDADSQLFVSMMINEDVVIADDLSEASRDEIEGIRLSKQSSSVYIDAQQNNHNALVDGNIRLSKQSSIYIDAEQNNEERDSLRRPASEVSMALDQEDVADIFKYTQEYNAGAVANDYDNEEAFPVPPRVSEGASSIKTIIKNGSLDQKTTMVRPQKDIKLFPSVLETAPLSLPAMSPSTNATFPEAAADTPVSKMIAEETLSISKLAIKTHYGNRTDSSFVAPPSSSYVGPPPLLVSPKPKLTSPTMLAIQTDVLHNLEAPLSANASGPPPLPTSPKPVKQFVASVPKAASSPKHEASVSSGILNSGMAALSLQDGSPVKTKKDRPKTLLQELKELTDNVAKRRQDITSVMFNDRAYIVGIMDAFHEVDEKENGLESPEVGKSFHPDIDEVLSALDKRVAPEHMREISGPLLSKAATPQQSASPPQSTKKKRRPTAIEVAAAAAAKPKDGKGDLKSPLESNFIIPFVHESDAELKKQIIVSKSIQSLPKPSTEDQPSIPFDPTISIPGESKEPIKKTISMQTLNPWMIPQKQTQLLMIPLNAMFDIQALDMTETHRFGRNNTTNHPYFKGFPTLVVSRNHADFWEKRKKIYMRDIGSSSGTFRNQVRLSPPNQKSAEVEIFTGDYIQLGKDFQDDSPLDQYGRIAARKRCVKFQIIIIAPGQSVLDAIKDQSIPIEKPLNRSQETQAQIEGVSELQSLQSQGPAKPIPPISDRPKTKITAPPPPPLPVKEKPASVVEKPIETLSSRINDVGTDSQIGVRSFQSYQSVSHTNLNKLRLGDNIDNLDDNGFPIKDGFKHKALNDQYVISYTIASGKVTKLQVNNAANGQLVIDTSLTRWEDKSRITITDFRLVAQRTFDIFLETRPGAKVPVKLKSFSENLPWQVSNNSGMSIGHLIFVNDIKMEIVSIDKPADGAQISITGDFKQKKLMFIKKWPGSREQARFGECQGKYQTKKSFLDSQWVANVEVESGSNSRLLLCGIILTCCLNP